MMEISYGAWMMNFWNQVEIPRARERTLPLSSPSPHQENTQISPNVGTPTRWAWTWTNDPEYVLGCFFRFRVLMGVPGIWSRPFLGISSVLQKFLLSGNEQANRILISERSEPSTYLSNTKGVEYHGGNCNQHSLFFTNFGGTPNRVCFYHMFPIISVKVRKAFAFEQVLGVSGPSTTSDKATISINNLIIAPVSLGLQQADDIELAGSNSSSSVARGGGNLRHRRNWTAKSFWWTSCFVRVAGSCCWLSFLPSFELPFTACNGIEVNFDSSFVLFNILTKWLGICDFFWFF